ncbi:PREDICTED: spatacsin-like [Tinamus guttatus]|uniref:spatacsin-like n=1 Tax=Tinamus guttatus TaxID=94827 RepID=UPI00052EAF9B|nr:PREDICTED: spatacsin-like [Tinamus guttatus]
MWESTEDCDLQVDKARILALNKSHELFLYEYTIEDGKYNQIPLHGCKEDALKKFLEVKHISLSSVWSSKILSFKDNTGILLLNNFLLVRFTFPGELLYSEQCDCFTLDVPPQALERITDTHFCRGVLFLLDSSGWICILCGRD